MPRGVDAMGDPHDVEPGFTTFSVTPQTKNTTLFNIFWLYLFTAEVAETAETK
jgi:hypothetical protein